MTHAHGLALALVGRMNEVAHPGRALPQGLALLGIGHAAVAPVKAELERRTRRSVWSLQPHPRFDPEDDSYDLDARSRARGLDLVTITTARALRLNPLLTSLSPGVRVGPVVSWMILIDRRAAVLDGPTTPEGEPTAWIATSGPFLEAAVELWDATSAESTPALADGTPPPLGPRQLDVARGVCLGRTDGVIARHLGISERTVARDVAALLEVTGARSRTESILNMLGRGRRSRP